MSEETIEVRTFVWRGISIELRHELKYATMGDLHHLQVLAVAPDRAPLPITETGYLSHFYYGEPAEDTVAAVTEWLDEEAAKPEWRQKEASAKQLNLF
jgi:hypothetical protein